MKRLSDGCKQLPADKLGVVHIAFEATDGNDVEAIRYEKLLGSISEFDPGDKPLEYVYVHWFVPESPPNALMAFDETAHWHAVRASHPRPLKDGLLVLPSEVESRSGVHWVGDQSSSGSQGRSMTDLR